jgi:hypothetical protein
MGNTAEIFQRMTNSGQSVETSKSYSGTLLQKLADEQIPDESTDLEITFALDVSAIQAIFIKSDQAITIETNSGAAPDDTLNLLANVPYVWSSDSYFVNLLTTDITALFVTNASGATATLNIWVLVDPTP